MTTTMRCLCAFMLFCGVSFAQETQEPSAANYQYQFKIENVNNQADDATVKDIQTYSKDLFEVHPTFSQGTFKVSTTFPVPQDRITEYLELYGFPVTSIRIVKDGTILTTENETK